MEIEKQEKGDVVVLLPKGNLVFGGVKELEDILEALCNDACNIILDLKYIKFISANALGIIAYYAGCFREKQKGFKLIQINTNIRKLMDITGLLRIVEVFENENEAISSMGPRVGKLEKTFLWSGEDVS
ncbi:MAG: STAS domain-containing protein [Candidatus Kuenenia sp.]|nr:STAS domain-containing protein [Candidatus Kuenenia hertensis]